MTERLNSINRALSQATSNRLADIRGRANLDAADLKSSIYIGDTYDRHIKTAFQFFSQNPHIYSHENIQSHTRPQQRSQGVKMVIATFKQCKIDLLNDPEKFIHKAYSIGCFDSGLALKFHLQYMLYGISVKLFGTTPYHEKLLERATNLDDLGGFCLTEFYHGSFSKGIETKAYYDHSTESFIVTTDGTKGMKYWIGGSAETINIAVLWSQLIVDGVSHGPHPFIFPIRCQKTHKILPGITIGDCGPKNGYNIVDNGYIIIDNVRIPKTNLLNKLGTIDDEGKYFSMVSDKDKRFGLHMSALSGGRCVAAYSSCGAALNTLTTALRYACVRRQFSPLKKGEQIPIIDYPLTKSRLLPHIATAIVSICPSANMGRFYYSKESIFNKLDVLEEAHAISAALKMRVTSNTTAAIEESRTILGGHGYSAYSNIVTTYHGNDMLKTGEGQNHILIQQASIFLMRAIPKQKKTNILDLSFVWTAQPLDEQKIGSLRSLSTLQSLLQHLFIAKYQNAKNTLERLLKQNSKAQAWLHFHPQAGNSLSLNYAELFFFRVAKERISVSKSTANKDFLTNCTLLWGYGVLEKQCFGSFTLRKALKREILTLSDELIDGVVAATDIIAPPSSVIGSVFAEEAGEGFRDYLNTIFAVKDAFNMPQYYQEIIQSRKAIQLT